MKSEPYSYEISEVTITPSQVLEYLYCPRFTYFMECLKIPQREERRFKVQIGREVHERKSRQNIEYLRKRLGVVHKETSVYLVSLRDQVRGIVDEVLTLEDGSMAPLEYKFAEFRPYVFKTHRCQLTLEAMLIRENYGKEVNKGFLVYTRSKNRLEEVVLSETDFCFATKTVAEILNIIEMGYYPAVRRNQRKCVDCCYKNICV
jgi:CRISPR-associated exonuclease Cas4